jgi:hypothetical protein
VLYRPDAYSCGGNEAALKRRIINLAIEETMLWLGFFFIFPQR